MAAQALRRVGAAPDPDAEPSGRLTVLLSGREGELGEASLSYPEGRSLLPVGAARS